MKLSYFAETYAMFKAAVTFVNSHQHTRAAWRQLSPKKTLLKPGETRFASAFYMLERLLEVKPQLEQLVVSNDWRAALQHMPKPGRDAGDATKRTVQNEDLWSRAEMVRGQLGVSGLWVYVRAGAGWMDGWIDWC